MRLQLGTQLLFVETQWNPARVRVVRVVHQRAPEPFTLRGDGNRARANRDHHLVELRRALTRTATATYRARCRRADADHIGGRALDHHGHARVALDRGGRFVVIGHDAEAEREQAVDCRLRRRCLTERREHLADVAQEHRVRTDHEHTPARAWPRRSTGRRSPTRSASTSAAGSCSTGRELADVFEEDFDDPDSLAGSGGVPDPLLAELGRARTGQIRDIVATIQGEQDAIIRAPLETCLVVQGGPGTGKTAVGLHRAAFLLYEHRARLARGGVLVVGPEPGVPPLHQPGAAVARRDVGDADDGRRAARPPVPRRRRGRRSDRRGEGRRAHAHGDRAAPPPTRSASRPTASCSTCRGRPIRGERRRARRDGRRRCVRARCRHRAARTVPPRDRAPRVRRVHARHPARLRRGGARRRAAGRSRVAQGDRRVLAVGRRGRAGEVAADAARRARPGGRRRARRARSRRCCSGPVPRPTRGPRPTSRCSTRPRRCSRAARASTTTSWSTRRRTSRPCSCACWPGAPGATR